VHGEDHDAGLRRASHDLAHDIETTQSWHQQVEDQDIRLRFLDQIGDLEAVRDLTHDGEARLLLEQQAQALAHDRMVVGQDDAGHPPSLFGRSVSSGSSADTRVPTLASDSMARWPPTRRLLSCMPSSQLDRAGTPGAWRREVRAGPEMRGPRPPAM
jgi:hypothetical protein